MAHTRTLDAYCGRCVDTRAHVVLEDDPSSCRCTVCGQVQQTYEPVAM